VGKLIRRYTGIVDELFFSIKLGVSPNGEKKDLECGGGGKGGGTSYLQTEVSRGSYGKRLKVAPEKGNTKGGGGRS